MERRNCYAGKVLRVDPAMKNTRAGDGAL